MLKYFDRYQEVKKIIKKTENGNILTDNPFTENWNENEKNSVINELKICAENRGYIFGAYDCEKLIGFSALKNNFFGKKYKYLQLSELHVSNGYRGLGTGRKLFEMSVGKAKEMGADKIYISGHSAAETQNFYKKIGCTDAEEVNKFLAGKEPCDIQLEYKIK